MHAPTAQDLSKNSEILEILSGVYDRVIGNSDGTVANYIPELAKADPDKFGLAIATTTGALYSVGQAELEFTIQSISKAFAYCMALEIYGREKVFEHVGVEPSGDAFNAIVFDPHTNRPFNPMVNAGAITVTAMLREAAGDGALRLLLDRFSDAAGRPLVVSDAVYRSEAEAGDRNRAIGYLLRNVGAITGPCEPAVDLYFQQCSILVTANDLARMAATLANIGQNPVTGKQVFSVSAVRDTLSAMLSCGTYDYSGNWILDVGFPAKSGVGGGIAGVVNRQMGIGVYSPRLDPKGNSVRGTAAFRQLSDDLGLHIFEWSNYGSQYLRSSG
jgi:glutaminase